MTGYSALKGARPRRTKRKATRRGGPRLAKVKYQPPTARNQRKQIMSNTARIDRLVRFDRRHQIYTDYRLESSFSPNWNSWLANNLTDPIHWLSCLRQDSIVQRMSHTFCKRMQINMRCDLGPIFDESVIFNIFVVRPRYSAPTLTPLVANNDWIEQQPGMNVRLNSAKYKVIASKYITLTVPAFGQSIASAAPPGNPLTTYRKWQWNIPLNMSITVPGPDPTTITWQDKTIDDLPYYHRYYLMTYVSHTGVAPTGLPTIYYDVQFTCVNSD